MFVDVPVWPGHDTAVCRWPQVFHIHLAARQPEIRKPPRGHVTEQRREEANLSGDIRG